MNAENIMDTLRALRKARLALHRKMKNHHNKMEFLLLCQTLQEKRKETGQQDRMDAIQYSYLLEEEKEDYQAKADAPMRRYLQGMKDIAPAMILLPMEEAEALLLYYALGKTWPGIAKAMDEGRDYNRVQALAAAGLARLGVPHELIAAEMEEKAKQGTHANKGNRQSAA